MAFCPNCKGPVKPRAASCPRCHQALARRPRGMLHSRTADGRGGNRVALVISAVVAFVIVMVAIVSYSQMGADKRSDMNRKEREQKAMNDQKQEGR